MNIRGAILTLLGQNEIIKPDISALSNKHTQAENAKELTAWYETNRAVHIENVRDARRNLDQSLLTLSSATLGLGIAVIQMMDSSKHTVQNSSWIALSWILLGFTIISTLVSYASSESLSEQKLEDLKNEYLKDCKDNNLAIKEPAHKPQWHFLTWSRELWLVVFNRNFLELLNLAALAAFIGGFILLTVFCWANFEYRQKENMSEEKKNQSKHIEYAVQPKGDREEHGLKPMENTPKPVFTPAADSKPATENKPANQTPASDKK